MAKTKGRPKVYVKNLQVRLTQEVIDQLEQFIQLGQLDRATFYREIFQLGLASWKENKAQEKLDEINRTLFHTGIKL